MDILNYLIPHPSGEEWKQAVDILLAFILSSFIGFERELKLKSAGLRTHTLVGLAAALLILVSKYGFTDVLTDEHLRLDPSRVAAQIVSGIGFIGGGLIFVRKDIVHGLTTAATIWLTAAIGMACGTGLHMLALMACCGYFVAVFGYTAVLDRLRGTTNRLRIRYRSGHDAATLALALCADKEFAVLNFAVDQSCGDSKIASITLRIRGKASARDLIQELGRLPAVVSVDLNPPEE